ncbi:MAG: GH36 C-terminal domain-containing protein [Victivallaceae bacterium]|nr:GH36 C-terminal domain-containing protein [Victivallaceae bacterium]
MKPGGDFFRLAAPGDGPVTAWMCTAKDKSEFVFFAFRQAARPNAEIVTVRLAGLDPEAEYCAADGSCFTGEFLMNIGLRLPEAYGDAWSELLCFRRK